MTDDVRYAIPDDLPIEPWAVNLTPADAEFVREFLVDLNACQAMIRCGSTEVNARRHCTRTMRRPAIARAIAAAMHERAEALGITAKLVLGEAFRSYTLAIEARQFGAAARFLELIGRHVDVRAFRDRYTPGIDQGDDGEVQLNLGALSTDEKRTLLAYLDRVGATQSVETGGEPPRLN